MLKPGHHMIVGALALAATSATAALADVKAGVDAYQRGDHAGAIREWRPLADKGDPDAQFNLAQAYKLGRGVPANLDTAIGWYRKAAMQNHAEAEALLGLLLFQNGKRAEAMPWLSKAADRGDSASQYVYGTALFNGDLVAKDWPRAYNLMTQAAAQGLPPARNALTEMDKFIPLAQRQQGAATARTAMASRSAPPPARVASNAPRQPLPPRAVIDNGPPARPTAVPPGAVARPAPPVARPVVTRPVAAKPAPRPAVARPAVAGPAAPAARMGGWKVQLGAFSQPAGANALFATLKKRVGALSGAQPILVRAGAVTRLQAGPFASRAAAAGACASVKAATGQACFPVAP